MHLNFATMQTMLLAEQQKNVKMQATMNGEFVCVSVPACYACMYQYIYIDLLDIIHSYDEQYEKYVYCKYKTSGAFDSAMRRISCAVHTGICAKEYASWHRCLQAPAASR